MLKINIEYEYNLNAGKSFSGPSKVSMKFTIGQSYISQSYDIIADITCGLYVNFIYEWWDL